VLRRKFLAYLGTLPVISDWKEALGHTRPKVPIVRDQKWKDRFLAVETLRLINTAEKWNFQTTNEHVSREHLHECIGYKKLIEKLSGRFRSVLDNCHRTAVYKCRATMFSLRLVPTCPDT